MFVDFNILNQLGSPSINSNTFANRPAAGQTGRLFVSTDTFEIYRDNGTGWDLIGGPGSSTVTGSGATGQVTYWTGTNTVSGENALFWDAAQNHLGINTATPTVALDVHSAADVALQLNGTGATPSIFQQFLSAGVSQYQVGYNWNASANYRRFSIYDSQGSKEVISIDQQSRYVGINYQYSSLSDQPAYTLDVSGDIRANNFYITNNAQTTYLSIYYPTGAAGNNLFIGGGGTLSQYTSGSSGSYNTYIGWASGQDNTTGYANTGIGYAAGPNVTTGIANSFLGYQTGFFHTTGTGCTYVGVDAGFNCTTNNYNTIIGFHACGGNAGAENVLIGADTAVNTNYTGANNVFVGYRTGYNNTTASNNVFLGNLSGFSNTTAASQVFIGADSGFSNTTGSQNTIIGYRSGYFNTTGASNVFLGTFSGFYNSTANSHTFIGVESGFNNTTGASNTFIGFRAAYKNTTGYNNVYVGDITAFENTTGFNNVGVGTQSGYRITTGDSNTFIGAYSGQNASQLATAINSTAIGNGSFTTASNQIVLGNTSVTEVITSGSIKTGAPTTGTAANWKLGQRVAAAVVLDATQYIEVEVGGTFYKIAIVT